MRHGRPVIDPANSAQRVPPHTAHGRASRHRPTRKSPPSLWDTITVAFEGADQIDSPNRKTCRCPAGEKSMVESHDMHSEMAPIRTAPVHITWRATSRTTSAIPIAATAFANPAADAVAAAKLAARANPVAVVPPATAAHAMFAALMTASPVIRCGFAFRSGRSSRCSAACTASRARTTRPATAATSASTKASTLASKCRPPMPATKSAIEPFTAS